MLVERVTMAKGGMPPRNKKNFITKKRLREDEINFQKLRS